MSKINGLDLEEIAELIVFDLEGDVLNRPSLAKDWEELDRGTIDDIRYLWREIIVERLQKIVEPRDDIEEKIDSDVYSL